MHFSSNHKFSLHLDTKCSSFAVTSPLCLVIIAAMSPWVQGKGIASIDEFCHHGSAVLHSKVNPSLTSVCNPTQTMV